MLIDTRPRPSTAVPTATLPPTCVTVDTSTVTRSSISLRGLVSEAGVLVAGLGVGDGARWAEASAAVAATAATLRSSLIDLTVATRLLFAEPVNAVPVAATAAPVVRAREIGFLTSQLAAVLDDVSEHDQIHATMDAVRGRLENDLQALRRAIDVDAASTPRRQRTAHFWRR